MTKTPAVETASPALVTFALAMVRRRAGAKVEDALLTVGELDRAVEKKAQAFGRMSTPELAAKLLLDMHNDEFVRDMR